jgi:hypothetical protein
MDQPTPPTYAIAAALGAAMRSPCQKSQRGVAAFTATGLNGTGHNYPAGAETCDGSVQCRRTCAARCIHAEADALRSLEWEIPEFELVHVELVRPRPTEAELARARIPWVPGATEAKGLAELEAMIVPCGPPSCGECSKLIATDERVDAIWLFHRPGVRVAEGTVGSSPALEHPPGGPAGWSELPGGWRRWPSAAFHRETLVQCQVHPHTPENRGTVDYPCEACGNTSTGSTRDERGFMRCNVCGYPSP